MPSENLTARLVEGLKPGKSRLEYFDRRVPGLALRVSMAGGKSWVLLYRHHRRLRRWTIGRYPTLSLADARERAREGLRDAQHGQDPAEAKQNAYDADTFQELADRYIAEYAEPRKRTWKDDRRLLRTEVLPYWRHRPAGEIRRRDVRELVEAVARRGAPILANRLRALLHTVFRFAVASDVVEVNPVSGVPRPGVERQRDRVLTEAEIRHLWAALEPFPEAMAAGFKLRLLTAQRGGEVFDMRWADLDMAGGWWTIPGDRAKNGLPHRVPLTAPVLTTLMGLRRKADQPGKSKQAVAAPVYVLAGARGKRQRSEASQTLGIPNFVGHDLRRTAASYMASAGVSRLVISKILNHVERGVTAVYDRHSYDAEKRTALETWARTLNEILQNSSVTVVPIGQRR